MANLGLINLISKSEIVKFSLFDNHILTWLSVLAVYCPLVSAPSPRERLLHSWAMTAEGGCWVQATQGWTLCSRQRCLWAPTLPTAGSSLGNPWSRLTTALYPDSVSSRIECLWMEFHLVQPKIWSIGIVKFCKFYAYWFKRCVVLHDYRSAEALSRYPSSIRP